MGSKLGNSLLFFSTYNHFQDFEEQLHNLLENKSGYLSFTDHDLSVSSPNLYYKNQIIKSCQFKRVFDKISQKYTLQISKLVTVDVTKTKGAKDSFVVKKDKYEAVLSIQRRRMPQYTLNKRNLICLKINNDVGVQITYLNPFDMFMAMSQSTKAVDCFVIANRSWGKRDKGIFFEKTTTLDGHQDCHNYRYFTQTNRVFINHITILLSSFFNVLKKQAVQEKNNLKAELKRVDPIDYYTALYFYGSGRQECQHIINDLLSNILKLKGKSNISYDCQKKRKAINTHFSRFLSAVEGKNIPYYNPKKMYNKKQKAQIRLAKQKYNEFWLKTEEVFLDKFKEEISTLEDRKTKKAEEKFIIEFKKISARIKSIIYYYRCRIFYKKMDYKQLSQIAETKKLLDVMEIGTEIYQSKALSYNNSRCYLVTNRKQSTLLETFGKDTFIDFTKWISSNKKIQLECIKSAGERVSNREIIEIITSRN